MNVFKLMFEKYFERYTDKKTKLKNRLDKWEGEGKDELCKKWNTILKSADGLAEEIKVILSSTNVDGKKSELRSKLRKFKKFYKVVNEGTKSQVRQWVEAIVVAGLAAFVLRTYIFGLYHVPTGSAEPSILVGDRVWGNKMAYYLGKPKHGDLVIFDSPTFVYNRKSVFKSWWQKYVGLPVPLLGMSPGPINLVKRVIAVPGDWIEGKLEEGKPVIYLNGKKLKETYVNPYPLKYVRRDLGFFRGDLPFVPRFLRRTYKEVRYTYVPGVSYEDQPYYHMEEENIVPISPEIDLIHNWPHTPSIDMSTGTVRDSFGPIKVPEGKYWVMGDSRKNSQDARWFGLLDEQLIHGKLSFIIYSIDSEEQLWLLELLKHPINFWRKSVRWNRFIKRTDFSNEK